MWAPVLGIARARTGPVSNGKPEGPLKKATEAQLKELVLSGVE